MSLNEKLARNLARTGQVASYEDLEKLVFDFERALSRHGVRICPGTDLEGACCSVLEVLGKNRDQGIRNSQEDVRQVFTEVLGIWTFLAKVVRLQNHPSFGQFRPHLELLNKGTVGQNKRLRACQDAANKIFELLFALVLLDLSSDVLLAHPDLEDTSNPDILATLDGQRWGFACKTIYGRPAKTLFDNLKRGVEQIEVSSASIGCVMVNLRNLLDHGAYWPILNEKEYRAGAEPVFSAYQEPGDVVGPQLQQVITQKRDELIAHEDLGYQNVINLFAGKKALPGFLAFCQTACGKVSPAGPIPTSITTLGVATFAELQAYQPLFERMNQALHERLP